MQLWQRSDDEDDDDYSFISNKKQCEATALKTIAPSIPAKAVTPFANENVKPIGDRDGKVETSRFHVIKRTIPLQTLGSEPSHCLSNIDKMYNIYYELEVSVIICLLKNYPCRHCQLLNSRLNIIGEI